MQILLIAKEVEKVYPTKLQKRKDGTIVWKSTAPNPEICFMGWDNIKKIKVDILDLPLVIKICANKKEYKAKASKLLDEGYEEVLGVILDRTITMRKKRDG